MIAESEWINRARAGQEAAWEALVHQHQEPVFRLAYLWLGDPAEAQDVAQEAFIRAYQALDRFDLNRPLRPWLLQITSNLARNRRRSVARYLAALQRKLRAEPEPIFNVEQTSAQQQTAQTLWQAVRRLATLDQEVIYLRFFLDLSEAEMADSLNVPAGTVKSRLHRALQRLRALITTEFPDVQPWLEG